jgi:fatty-acid desaturase
VSRLSWGRVLAISVVYIVIVNAIGVLLFLARMRSHFALHPGEPSTAGPFFAVWVLCALGPPLLLAALYGRYRRRDAQLPEAAG